MQLERYCTCGAVLRVTVPREKKQQVLGNWFEKHAGEGHAPATREQAQEARGTPDSPPRKNDPLYCADQLAEAAADLPDVVKSARLKQALSNYRKARL